MSFDRHRMTERSAALLRAIHARGPMTAAQARPIVPELSADIWRTLSNLRRLGYLQLAERAGESGPRCYAVSERGIEWLDNPTRDARARKSTPAPAVAAPEPYVGQIAQPPRFRTVNAYDPSQDMRPPARAESMRAYLLPSRRSDGFWVRGQKVAAA